MTVIGMQTSAPTAPCPPPFALRDAAPNELWCPEHRPADEATEPLILPQLLSLTEIDMLMNAAGPAYPPRKHHMLRGTTTGPAAVHDVRESEGHCKLFLHRGGHFQAEWPELSAKLMKAMCSQQGFPKADHAAKASELSLRCAEFHTYNAGGGLMARGHRDRGSVLTMAVLLSDPTACEGGEFITWVADGAQPVRHAMGRGDAILFHSEKTHNVANITSGVRHSLVLELWRLPQGRESANMFDRSR